MKRLRIASLSCLALFAGAVWAQDSVQPQIHVLVDGEELSFPNQQPVKTNGRVLVPLRGVFEKLGATVDWDPDKQSITAIRRDTRIHLVVGELDATVNERVVHLDVPPTVVDGSTMVPLRFVSEALGENVAWNSFQNEVDITRGVDYNIPKPDNREHHGPPAVIHPAPPHRPVAPPVTRIQTVVDVPADSVIPFKLDDRLTSFDAQAGDTFTATLMTDGIHRYFGLPSGTIVYGHVSYVQRRDGPDPGIMELRFDKLRTPGGTTLPVRGQLIGLDDPNLTKGPHGTFVAKTVVRNQRVVYTGYGPGAGIVLGFHGDHAIADVDLRMWARRTVTKEIARRETSEVELVPGTQLGLRLYQDLTFPANLH